MVLEALKFMILGMGIVFLFLMVLIWAINFQAKLIEKYFSNGGQKAQGAVASTAAAQASSGIDKKKVAAIVGALAEHKKTAKGV